MRCKTCDYPLWHITSRTCPECGSSFKPSDYEFTLNSVRFCCPHCQQAYYGTGPKGELVPRAFACVGCGKHIDMDEMVLLPTEGVQEERTEGHRQPWLEWGTRRGFWSAWFGAIGHAMVMPGRLMKATPPESPAGKATSFAAWVLITVALGTGLPWLLFSILLGIGGPMATGGGGGGFGGGLMFAATFAFGYVMLMLVFGVCALLTLTGVTHGILLITGGCSHGIKRTWQAICYSSGAYVVTAVPCIGVYFGWIWWVVSACVAVKEAQRVHGGRASLAVLAAPITFVLLFITMYAILIFGAVNMASSAAKTAQAQAAAARSTRGGPGVAPAAPSIDRTRITIIAYGIKSSRKPVRHVAEVLAFQSVNVYQFMDMSDDAAGGYTARMSLVPIGRTDLNSYEVSTPREQRRQEQLAADLIDPKTIAYRVGDTVLTHRGIDCGAIAPGSDAEKLWLAIAWRESLTDPTADRGRVIAVGCADGQDHSFPLDTFSTALAEQNALRAKYGLPALPSPEMVTHQNPALGAAEPKMTDPSASNSTP